MSNLKVFNFKDYRKLIEHLFVNKKILMGATYAKAAKHARVQATYFSNVLKGRADFNEDQIFAIAEYLSLDDLEFNFLRTLHQIQRSQLKSRREVLQKHLETLKTQAESHAKRLDIAPVEQSKQEDEMIFYLDPRHQLLLFALALVPEVENLLSVGRALDFSDQNTKDLLQHLIFLKKIRIENQKFVREPVRSHLGTDSKLLNLHQAAIRALSVEKMRKLLRSDFKSLSVTFSTSTKEHLAIQDLISRCLDDIRELVKNSVHADDQVCQINLDFFSWFQKS